MPSLAHDVITKSRPANKGFHADRGYKSSGRPAQKPNNKPSTRPSSRPSTSRPSARPF